MSFLNKLGAAFSNAIRRLDELDQQYPRAGYYRNKIKARHGSPVREVTDEHGNIVMDSDGKPKTIRLDKV